MERTYTIGEVAGEMGIPASTIRYYDSNGLLPGVLRTEGGMRLFTRADLEWLRLVGYLKMSGMTIREIRDFVELYQGGDATIEQRRALVHGRRSEIERQMAELQQTLDFITYKCWYYDTASAAGTCAVVESMTEEDMPPHIAEIKRRCDDQAR